MQELIKKINEQIEVIRVDIQKTTNKSAMARVRMATLELEKLGKEYRKVSVATAKALKA